VCHSEALYEDDSFPERELAALVAAKVYYQLQEYNESMVFALGAGKLFDIHKAAEFEETIMGKTYTNTQACGARTPSCRVSDLHLDIPSTNSPSS
jgi:26S proteasome regulatory subunit N2